MKVTPLGQNHALFSSVLIFFCCEWCQYGGMGLELQVVSEMDGDWEEWMALESSAFVHLHPADSLGEDTSRSGLSEFTLRDPQDGRRELSPARCPLTTAHSLWYVSPTPPTHS